MQIKIDKDRLKEFFNENKKSYAFGFIFLLIVRIIIVYSNIDSYNNPIISIITPAIFGILLAVVVNVIYLKVEGIIKFSDIKD